MLYTNLFQKPNLKGRAWVEINLDNLEHNVNTIKKQLHNNTKIIAVVKTNAYGCGDLLISKKLMEIGIEDFAVATIAEGIKLRENGIKGNILILGYTSPEELQCVIDYDMIQTIVDFDYAEIVKSLKLTKKLKCHIKVNTGMNRIGESYKNIDKLSKIYENKALDVLGIFSHLCASDSNHLNDIIYTETQIDNFDYCINKLKNKGYNIGKTHIQASYGIVNYPGLKYDYARPGIILYGLNSFIEEDKLGLKPVLSLKARVTSVKEVGSRERIGYGDTTVYQKKKIAVLSIGYADGIPRALFEKDMVVKVNDAFVKVIGKICMDQMMIDVTDKNVKVGDIATLIGEEYPISAEVVAKEAGTITNELLSRLGERLPRIAV